MSAPQSRLNVHRLRRWLLVLRVALFTQIWRNLRIPDPPAPTPASTGGWQVPTLFDPVGGRPAITVFEGRWDGPTN